MDTIVVLKSTSGEDNTEYFRLKQLDVVSECCISVGRYDEEHISNPEGEEMWQVVSGDIGEADSVVESLIRLNELAGSEL